MKMTLTSTKLIELIANYCRCMLRRVSTDLVRDGELTKESTSLLSCSYLHIQIRAVVVSVGWVTLVEGKGTVIVEGEPEEDWCARREVKWIAPVIERSRASDSKEPGAAVIVDGVWRQPVTCKRVIIVRVVYLEVTGAQGHAIERSGWVNIGIVIETLDDFATIHCLRPDPGTNAYRYRCLHVQVYLDAGSDAHSELATTGAIDTNLLRWGDVDQGRGQDLLRGGRCYFEYNTAKGQEGVLR